MKTYIFGIEISGRHTTTALWYSNCSTRCSTPAAGLPDPFAKITVAESGQHHSTSVARGTLDPKWIQHYDMLAKTLLLLLSPFHFSSFAVSRLRLRGLANLYRAPIRSRAPERSRAPIRSRALIRYQFIVNWEFSLAILECTMKILLPNISNTHADTPRHILWHTYAIYLVWIEV